MAKSFHPAAEKIKVRRGIWIMRKAISDFGGYDERERELTIDLEFVNISHLSKKSRG